jgi:hypothetical protein
MHRQRVFTRGAATTRGPVLALILMLLLVSTPVRGQEQLPPLSFEDPAALTVTWPAPIRITVHNNTTDWIVALVHVTVLADSTTGVPLLADTTLFDVSPTLTLQPAGESYVELVPSETVAPQPGTYTGSIVLSDPGRRTVIRKSVTVVVPEEVRPPLPIPAVETWTLNALRVVPFTNPICLRGLSLGCTLPIADAGAARRVPALLGYLGNDRGGGLVVTLLGTSSARTTARRGIAPVYAGAPGALEAAYPPARPGGGTHNAQLGLAFVDAYGGVQRWGLTGIYSGQLYFEPGNGTETGDLNVPARRVDLVVTVKDIVIWPILVLILGVWAARAAQRHLTMHYDTRELMNRLDAATRQFAELRASIYGYTVREDVVARRQELRNEIRAWDRTHFGAPTPAEQERFTRTITEPLAAFESQIAGWATFREKLDRLRRKMEYAAKPAIEHAELPTGLSVKIESGGLPALPEPRFYTVARSLLQGYQMELAQVPAVAERIDQAADIAAVWGEYDQMVTLIRDGLRQLYNPVVELSISEEELLERARQHLNSAARDLWEARNLTELRERETQAELAEARDIIQRLLDPFVYYTPSEEAGHTVTTPAVPGAAVPGAAVRGAAVRGADVPGAAAFAPDDGSALLDSYPAPVAAFLQPMVRSYNRLSTYHLPGLDAARPPAGPAPRTGSASASPPSGARALIGGATALVGESTVTWAALIVALMAGLNTYTTSHFGAFGDYLTLFTWAFAIKLGLELANTLLGKWLGATGQG